ncbi:phosphatidate cytidylyltransferase [Klenkia soli]|uniref:Phosphatidate cytidylyltransferase n=1 Tax=Klenkia soli TaxID=1052260 RepID=A0A1H0I4K0_9ACTN|nr:phosphatidate cytidylyltransferase [Klenkia soli]SDO26364.1 phosphatidate cytidylyltransferase [Klenkia soli]
MASSAPSSPQPGPDGPGRGRARLAEPSTEALPLPARPGLAPPPAQRRPEVPPPATPVEAVDDAPLTALPDALGAEVTGAEPADTPTGAPRTSRAGRNLGAAIGVGAGMGAVVIASLFLYRPSFLLVVALAVVVSVTELVRALDRGGYRPPLAPVLVGGLLMIGLAWTRGSAGLVVAFLLTVLAVLLWRLGDGPVGYLRDASAAVLVALYVPLLAGFAVLLLSADDGTARVLLFIATVVCSDVGGFAAGVLLGKKLFGDRPMAGSISPKKSWEGFFGSVLACVLIGTLVITLTFHGPWWGGIAFGVAMAATATLGDLAESLIKRDLGIKDMGALLPGHGGLMDRMDSLLPSAVVAYLLLQAIVPA